MVEATDLLMCLLGYMGSLDVWAPRLLELEAWADRTLAQISFAGAAAFQFQPPSSPVTPIFGNAAFGGAFSLDAPTQSCGASIDATASSPQYQASACCAVCREVVRGAQWVATSLSASSQVVCGPCYRLDPGRPAGTFTLVWPPTVPWLASSCYLLDLVSDDVLLEICLRLALPELSALMRTCKRLAELRTWNVLWRGVTRQRYVDVLVWADCRPEPLYFDRLRIARELRDFPPHLVSAEPWFSHGAGPAEPLIAAQNVIHLQAPDASCRSDMLVVMDDCVYFLGQGSVLCGRMSTGEHVWTCSLDPFHDVYDMLFLHRARWPPAIARPPPAPHLLPLAAVNSVVVTDQLSVWLVSSGGMDRLQLHLSPFEAMVSPLAAVGTRRVAFVKAVVGSAADARLFGAQTPDVQLFYRLQGLFPLFRGHSSAIRTGVADLLPWLLALCVQHGLEDALSFIMAERELEDAQVEALLPDVQLVPLLRRLFEARDALALQWHSLAESFPDTWDTNDLTEEDADNPLLFDDDGDGIGSDDAQDEPSGLWLPLGAAFKFPEGPPLAPLEDASLEELMVVVLLPALDTARIRSCEFRLPRAQLLQWAGLEDGPLAIVRTLWALEQPSSRELPLASWERYLAVPVVAQSGARRRALVVLVHVDFGVLARSAAWDYDTMQLVHCALAFDTQAEESADVVHGLRWVALCTDASNRSAARILTIAFAAARDAAPPVTCIALPLIHQGAPLGAVCNPATGMMYVSFAAAPLPERRDVPADAPPHVAAAALAEAALAVRPVVCVAVQLFGGAASVRWSFDVRLDHEPAPDDAPFPQGSSPLRQLRACSSMRLCDSALFLVGIDHNALCVAHLALLGHEPPAIVSLRSFVVRARAAADAPCAMAWDVRARPVKVAALLGGGHLVLASPSLSVPMAANPVLALDDLLRGNVLNMFRPFLRQFQGNLNGGLDEEDVDDDDDEDVRNDDYEEDDDLDEDGDGAFWCDECQEWHHE